MNTSSLETINEVIASGYCVVSADDAGVLAAVQDATRQGRSATFYVTRSQSALIEDWYWTPQKRAERGVEPVSEEEQGRIAEELGLPDAGFLYSNRLTCRNCGAVYGAYEFLQQGIAEHGRDNVDAAFTLPDTVIVRVNPRAVAVCQTCGKPLHASSSAPSSDPAVTERSSTRKSATFADEASAQEEEEVLTENAAGGHGHEYHCRQYYCCSTHPI